MQTYRFQGGSFFQILKSVGIALLFSLLSVAALGGALRYFGASDKIVYPINQAVKVLAIAIGCLAGLREEKGLIKGIGVGLLFTALSYLAFSAIGGDFSLSWLIFAEIAIGAAAGAVGGALAVNLRRN